MGDNPFGLAVGDFNGDGIADLAVANESSNTVTILLGDATGHFAPVPGSQQVAVGNNPNGVSVGDFNGDGHADLAGGNSRGDGTVSILLGNGTGHFTTEPPITVGNHPRLVAVGDFNGDGHADLAVANSGDGTVNILLGTAGGFTQPAGSPITVGASPRSVTIGDFNGDGVADLAVADSGPSNNTVTILLGNGSGGFTSPQSRRSRWIVIPTPWL